MFYPEFKHMIRFRVNWRGKLILQMLIEETDFGVPNVTDKRLRWRDARPEDLRLIYNNPKLRVGVGDPT